MLGDLGSLTAGVIYQAWSDAGAGIVRGTRRAESEKDRHEAARFLTAEHGPWARSRKHWAEIAGVCPDSLRARALDALGLKEAPEPEPAVLPDKMPRAGTKLAAVVDLLRQPEGVSLDEMQRMFGWARITCSTVVTGDLPMKFGIRSKRGPDGRYRIVQAA
jgi:hypothetical protein